MEIILYHHGTWVEVRVFVSFPCLHFIFILFIYIYIFFLKNEKNVGLGVKIRVGRVTGNQHFFVALAFMLKTITRLIQCIVKPLPEKLHFWAEKCLSLSTLFCYKT
jgi:hypothetical protein